VPSKAGKKAKPAPAKDTSAPRAESKGAKILELIGRPKGATLSEIVKATDWQKHSIRGFLSTTAKKHGLKIESTKTEAGDRVYQAKK
jgi:predicted transcriptional regulator